MQREKIDDRKLGLKGENEELDDGELGLKRERRNLMK